MADKFELKAILSAVDKMSPALKSIAQAAKGTRKYLLDVGNATGKLSGSLGLPALGAGLLGGLSLVEVKNSINGITEYASEIKKAGYITGETTDDIQRLKYVAGQADVPFESLVDSVGKLNKNLGIASAGGAPELTSLLKHLGINMKDANGQLRLGADMLPELAKFFKLNTNAVVQSRMGVVLFGKSYKEVLPLLMEGGDGIARSFARFKQIGNIIPQSDIDAAKDFGDQLGDVAMVTKGVGFSIAKELIPTLRPLVEDFIQWAAANKRVMATRVKQFVTGLVGELKSYDWAGFIQNVKSIASSFGWVVDKVGGAKNALILLAIVMNANAIMATIGLIGAVGRLGLAFIGMAAKAYLAGNASTLAFIKIAATALYIAGPIGAASAAFSWFVGIFTGGSSLIAGALGIIRAAWAGLGAALLANPLGIILGLASAALLIYQNWDTLKKWFYDFFDWFGEKVATVMAFFGSEDAKMALEVSKTHKSVMENVDTASLKNSANSASQPGALDQSAPLMLQQQTQRVGGEITVSFANAPQGMRVEQTRTDGPLQLNANVGYRSFALNGF